MEKTSGEEEAESGEGPRGEARGGTGAAAGTR